jgi:hypothetical protein
MYSLGSHVNKFIHKTAIIKSAAFRDIGFLKNFGFGYIHTVFMTIIKHSRIAYSILLAPSVSYSYEIGTSLRSTVQ